VTKTVLLCALVVGGCGTGEGASYILLDQEARAARVEVEVDGRPFGGALPIEVQAGGEVLLVTPVERRRLAIAPATLYEARGWPVAVVPSRLGEDVRTDLVDVDGPAARVRDLGSALGAGTPEPWVGHWRLQGADVLVRLAWMGDLPDISAVAAIPTETPRAAGVPAPAVSSDPDPALAPLVGLYVSRAGRTPSTLFLDAGGGFELLGDCASGPRTGRYHVADGRLSLAGAGLTFTIAAGRLEAPGLDLSTEEDR
jgi:hypothetical protein